MPHQKPIDVVIAIPKLKGQALHAAVDELAARGLRGASLLDKLGVVTGSIEPERMHSLESVEGVTYVRPARKAQIVRPVPATGGAEGEEGE
jgi:hypothetical protein